MKVNYKRNIVTLFILQLILSYFVVIFSTPVMAANKLASCATGMAFFLNGNEFKGSTILIDKKNTYVLQVGIAQLDNTACQPAFFWRVMESSKAIDSGRISSNINFTKNINISSPTPRIYTYILGLSEDEAFTTGTVYKDLKIAFTTNPKEASPVTTKTPAKTTTTDDEGIPQEAAGYVARTYDGADWSGSLTINNPSGKTDIAELVTKLINWLLLIIGMVATVVIIISGIMLVFNGGSEATIKKAKTTILWAVLGLVISIGAFALVNIIQSLL